METLVSMVECARLGLQVDGISARPAEEHERALVNLAVAWQTGNLPVLGAYIPATPLSELSDFPDALLMTYYAGLCAFLRCYDVRNPASYADAMDAARGAVLHKVPALSGRNQ